MNHAAAAPEQSVRALLFPEDHNTTEAIARALGTSGVLKGLDDALTSLSTAGRKAVDQEVAKVIDGVLGLDVIEILVAGWQKYAALKESARRTRASPDTKEVVELATHRVSSIHRPKVDLLVQDVRVTTVQLELRLDLLVRALTAVVSRGRLTAVGSPQFEGTVILRAQGWELARRQGEIEIPLSVRLGDGYPLLPPDPSAQQRTLERTG